MIINKIIIQNFGSHQDTCVDLTQADTTPIVGDNGSGKTTIIESVPACLFGIWPSRGNLVEGVTEGFTGNSYLAIEFEINGDNYVAERKCRKTANGFSQDAYLSKGTMHIAGPKISDFDLAVEQIIGDPKVFFASVFSAQNKFGDIVDCKPADRKRILAALLDLERLQLNAERWGVLQKDTRNTLDSTMAKVESVSSLKSDILDGLPTEVINELKGTTDPLRYLISKKESLEFKIEEQKSKVTRSQNSLKPLNDGLSKMYELTLDYQTLKAQKEDIQCDIEKADLLIAENRDLANNLPNLQKKQSDRESILNHNLSVENENKTIQASKTKSQIVIANYVTESQKRNTLLRQCDILESDNFNHTPCKSCDFLSDANKAKEDVKNIQLISDKAVEHHKEVMDQKVIPLNTVPPDHSESIIEASKADGRINELYAHQKALIDKLSDVETQLNATPPPDERGLNEKRENIRSIEAQIENTQQLIESMSLDVRKIESIYTTIKERMEQNKRIEEQIIEDASKIKSLEHSEKIYTYLKNAFGKDGIQAYLIDSAIPRLQDISDELMSVATDGKMTLLFKTEKVLKSGGTSESLVILCDDGTKTMEISKYSGGEKNIIKTVIRLTLTIFKSETTGSKLETLVLDEVFDALDDDNAHKIVLLLGSVKKRFKKIIFVSHNNSILTDFPNKLFVEKREKVSCVA